MSVGFGFSAGDFIAALKLVGTIIDALRESSTSGSTYRELLNELYALETALLHVKRLGLDDSQHVDTAALRYAASQCQTTIDAFWKKVQKYQPHLRHGGTNSKIKDGWAKIKWAVCRTEDLQRFRTEIAAHTGSIEVLLLTVQMKMTAMHNREQQDQYKTLTQRIQDLTYTGMNKLATVAKGVATSIQQGQTLVLCSMKILETTLRTFQMVQDVHTFMKRVPTEVQRQNLVYIIDAFNRAGTFDLDFIRSAEALVSVLKANSRATGCGPGMIDRGEFLIEESGTHKRIDLSGDWDTCFYPGQRVAMSMIFKTYRVSISCSDCGTISYMSLLGEQTWVCRISFHYINELIQGGQLITHVPRNAEAQKHIEDYAPESSKFQRVHLLNKNLVRSSAPSYQNDHYYEFDDDGDILDSVWVEQRPEHIK